VIIAMVRSHTKRQQSKTLSPQLHLPVDCGISLHSRFGISMMKYLHQKSSLRFSLERDTNRLATFFNSSRSFQQLSLPCEQPPLLPHAPKKVNPRLLRLLLTLAFEILHTLPDQKMSKLLLLHYPQLLSSHENHCLLFHSSE